ncbi:T6SS immunity protein Tdi1 domain-containing protein [Clostridium felsineum]|uniref:T6SS immunity protein Tdi1 domain-containing protein n=1 Tax=Clostridium felsineum TaxID=36839 RepID=UPI00098C5D6E|nr:T6SS immunity protein Tdi1 domain-containing protein [Clostridium felsineum]URZ03083.1 hypothetical protein CLAUR_031290 [Clostridium felsineum]
MNNDLFKEYKIENTVDRKIIDKYKYTIPSELISVWESYGFGILLGGYLKTINPDEYQDIINMSYFRANVAIPIFVTAFGDIITWEKNEYVSIVKYKNGTFDILLKRFKHFFNCLNDEYFLNTYLEIDKYNEAVERHSELEYDECFGYVPLLGLGGSEKVENLKKVKIKEHIELITQLVGKIE